MPYISTRQRMVHLQPLASQHYDTYESRMFDRTYLEDDVNNERWLYAGCVIALDHPAGTFVPYSAAASYGVGSDTPVAITKEPYDMTEGAKAVTGVFHARMVEQYCYLYGGARGVIPAAVKAALTQVSWV
jgi:hypothetical protein